MDASFETWQDARRIARRSLPRGVFDFIAGGAEEELTLRRNRSAFRAWALRAAVLRDVAGADPTTTVLGSRLAAPVLVAPMGGQSMAHPQAELAMVRATADAGLLSITSTASSTLLEDESRANPNRWFQLYVYRDRGITADLIARARAAGYQALVITVDAPVLGLRRRDLRNRFRPPTRIANLERYAAAALGDETDGTAVMRYFAEQVDPTLTFDGLSSLVAEAELPVLVKGVVRPDDAERALEAGAAGIYVSNHGGRQLDGGIATLDALPAIVEQVAGRTPIILDGGVRSPSDVLTALGLGATAVAVGRPALWALAAGGQVGVTHLLERLVTGVRTALALVGATSCDGLAKDALVRTRYEEA